MKQYKYNAEMEQWELINKIQIYKGVKIETVTFHMNYYGAERHREYQVTWADGTKSYFGINKRGGNIKELKSYIDYKTALTSR